MLIVGRIMAGFADVLSTPIGFMYITEISEVELRGSFLSTPNISSGLGIALGSEMQNGFLGHKLPLLVLI